MKKNNSFTVNDFIIFVRAKILIIFLCTSLLSSATIYFQNYYNDYWKVELSRNINKNSLLKAVQILNYKLSQEAIKLNVTPIRISTIDLLTSIESIHEQIIAGNLSTEGFYYSDKGETNKREIFKEKIYDLTLYNEIKKFEKKDLKNKIDLIIGNTNKLLSQILYVNYETDKLVGLKFFDYKIVDQREISGYEYIKILKVIVIYFTTFTLIFFLYDRRKSIKLL